MMDSLNELCGLAYECPARDRKIDCPFQPYDGRSFKDRILWIESLNQEKKFMIIQHHKQCAFER